MCLFALGYFLKSITGMYKKSACTLYTGFVKIS